MSRRVRKRKRINELLSELIFREQTKAITVGGWDPWARLLSGKLPGSLGPGCPHWD